jgi:hypothetical protein
MLNSIINKICLWSLKLGLIPVKVSRDFLFSDKIRREMKELGLRSKDISRPIGYSQSAVSLAIRSPKDEYSNLKKLIVHFIEQKKLEKKFA